MTFPGLSRRPGKVRARSSAARRPPRPIRVFRALVVRLVVALSAFVLTLPVQTVASPSPEPSPYSALAQALVHDFMDLPIGGPGQDASFVPPKSKCSADQINKIAIEKANIANRSDPGETVEKQIGDARALLQSVVAACGSDDPIAADIMEFVASYVEKQHTGSGRREAIDLRQRVLNILLVNPGREMFQVRVFEIHLSSELLYSDDYSQFTTDPSDLAAVIAMKKKDLAYWSGRTGPIASGEIADANKDIVTALQVLGRYAEAEPFARFLVQWAKTDTWGGQGSQKEYALGLGVNLFMQKKYGEAMGVLHANMASWDAPFRPQLASPNSMLGYSPAPTTSGYTNGQRGPSFQLYALALLRTEGASSNGNRPDAAVPAAFGQAWLAAQSARSSDSDRALAMRAAVATTHDSKLSPIVTDWERALNDYARVFNLAIRREHMYEYTPEDPRLQELEGEYRDKAFGLLQQIDAAMPSFRKSIDQDSISIEDVRRPAGVNSAGLQADEAVLLLLPPLSSISDTQGAEIGGIAFAISKDDVGWAEIPSRVAGRSTEDVVRALNQDANSMARSAGQNFKPGQQVFNRDLAHQLYQALFDSPQIARVIKNKQHLLVAAQGSFLNLPLSVLVTEPPEGSDGDVAALKNTKWLGLEKTISVLPSVTSLQSMRALNRERPPVRQIRTVPAEQRFLGFGDPDFDHSGSACKPVAVSDFAEPRSAREYFSMGAGNARAIASLVRLPGTCGEVQEMARILGASRDDVVLGDSATEAALRSHPQLGTARVIEFATHGLLAGDFGGKAYEPALVLTPPVTLETTENDGLLTASEVAMLKLNADWVVLSACNTAAGLDSGSEGLSGLARGFFYAGARSLLVSHWRVADDAASFLTTRTIYYSTVRGLSRPEALRQAMRDLVYQTPNTQDQILAGLTDARTVSNAENPATWASFFFVGTD